MGFLANSRFNPTTGILDFWNEIRKPTPYRWPILLASCIPIAALVFYLAGERQYKAPERPTIDYITSFEPERTDEEIIASNIENQEIKELREQQRQALADRKRDLYKALGEAAGMDVDEIEQRGEAERARLEAERQAQLDELMGRADGDDTVADAGESDPDTASESSAP